MTLYELTADYQTLLAMAEDPETDPETLADTMEAIEGDIEDKAEAYAIMISKLSAESDMFDKEMKRCKKNKEALDGNIERMRANLKTAMEATGKLKFDTAHFRFSIQKNGGLQPMEVIGEDVPDEYMKIKKEPDTTLIREALAAGCELPFARLKERGTRLNIK